MNRLLEVYSRGLYDSLNKESMAGVVEHFQNISNDTSVHELADLFKNKTVQKDEKLKAALELVINKTMLGGVVLKYKDNEIDLSVDNKLDGLNSVLTN